MKRKIKYQSRNNLKIYEKTKPGDTPDELSRKMPYAYKSHNERIVRFYKNNPGAFYKKNDYRSMKPNVRVRQIAGFQEAMISSEMVLIKLIFLCEYYQILFQLGVESGDRDRQPVLRHLS